MTPVGNPFTRLLRRLRDANILPLIHKRRPSRGPWSRTAVRERGERLPLRDRFAPEFVPGCYRAFYPALALRSDAALARHYERRGRAQGRVGAPQALRLQFIDALQTHEPALEIGAFHRPMLKGANTKHFDIRTHDQLVAYAAQIGEDPSGVPQIDFVSPLGDLSIVGGRFALVASSHVIEHQPDLVAHLAQVERLLEPGGLYALIVPDCRYCFDHFIAPSTIADAVAACMEGRRVHGLGKVIEMRALTAHNDAVRHWHGDHGAPDNVAAMTRAAIDEWEASAGGYVDVHGWRFTPESFRTIVTGLSDLALTGLSVHRVYPTPYRAGEFCAVLEKQDP